MFYVRSSWTGDMKTLGRKKKVELFVLNINAVRAISVRCMYLKVCSVTSDKGLILAELRGE